MASVNIFLLQGQILLPDLHNMFSSCYWNFFGVRPVIRLKALVKILESL
jgi:hypothetical protein